ncbi:hypothetical protein BJ684DRAFT_20135 [Piptocephalis cylindrospora]|uniref:Choline/carnitine acyltransferase domain-containing protein n=1 Tax=Piptocephalis cylindrospora TaxID=1907219 RepID=A0A4P9Y398_9FUNG|nr:hypothetical protein BJ684DRAFT_20135 [Piptocephalis cylindrospora]|eukprot:RKP13367.1 hypothetical protein BJ684DRAFT_20135 [Piptocephalis cylindrospora]
MSTFQFQETLPKLPIPDLDHTLQVLTQSINAILAASSSSSQKPHLPKDLQDALQEFAKSGTGQGRILQRRLQDHAWRVNRIDPPSARNWLDAWWSQAAYLTWRQPLMVNKDVSSRP